MCSLFDYGEPLKVLNYMSYEINCVNLFQDETQYITKGSFNTLPFFMLLSFSYGNILKGDFLFSLIGYQYSTKK